MNAGEIAERFIRAAEIERASREHVGPAPLRAQQLPYEHSFADKAGWRKEIGDKLEKGEMGRRADESQAFWERVHSTPTSEELAQLDELYDLLMMVDDDGERRALLAWARSKVGGKAFRRWCFKVEGIHPETGRRRKDRALSTISAHLDRKRSQNSETDCSPLLHSGPEIEDISDTVEEGAGQREGLNNWMADDAFAPFLTDGPLDFSWASKRNELRRQRQARRRKLAEKTSKTG